MAKNKPIQTQAWVRTPLGDRQVETLPPEMRRRLAGELKQSWCGALLQGVAQVQRAEKEGEGSAAPVLPE